MSLKDIQITPELRGVLAVPEGKGPFPAVVMVHEVFGIDDAMRSQITRLASAGYVVLMPDLFSRGGARKCLNATFRALTSGAGQAFDDVASAKHYLMSRDDVNDKTGVIGFCMGGGFALMLANRGYDAASVNYGMLPKDLDQVLGAACPIITSYGAKDGQLKGASAKLENTLTNLEIPHDVKEYPNSGHAFMNPHQAGGPFFGFILGKVMGAKPNPVDAEDAWKRIESFFAEHLKSA